MKIIDFKSDYKPNSWWKFTTDLKLNGKIIEKGTLILDSNLESFNPDLGIFLIENNFIKLLGFEESDEIDNLIKTDTNKCKIIELNKKEK